MAWEQSFAEKIGAIRNKELQTIKTQAIYRALYYGLSMSVPLVTTTVSLAVSVQQLSPLYLSLSISTMPTA